MALLETISRCLCRIVSNQAGILGLAAAVLVLPCVPPAAAREPAANEYQVKAVFLFNFAEFVEWPPGMFPDAQSPVVIGILGKDPFGQIMDEAVRGERVNNRPLVIQRYVRIEDVGLCHILFISQSETSRLGDILASLSGRSVLTVSDAEHFSMLGGMIRFVMENSKVRLRINLQAAKLAHLTISSKLLRPAEIVSMRRE
jgi:hypothetical protein